MDYQWVVCRATGGVHCEVLHTLCLIKLFQLMNNISQTTPSYLFVPKLQAPEVLAFSLVDPMCC